MAIRAGISSNDHYGPPRGKQTDWSRLWVNRVISGAGSDFRFAPGSDRIAAIRQLTRGPDLLIGA